ncbi:TPA: hypothetical protein HA265_02885 [Candidatus Woesearchaeota archaeon]|nr:hypothetical protein [Candidatus Woesearchaeota archaeon]
MVRLIVYNIEYCIGLTGRYLDYLKFWRFFTTPPRLEERMIAFLKEMKPDILALVEVDCGSLRTNRKDEAKDFSKSLHIDNREEMVKYSLTGMKKIIHYIPYLRKQSNAFISKYPLKDIRHHFLSAGMHNVVIQATINCPKKVTLLLAHLALHRRTRRLQIEEITGIVRGVKGPVMLMGDFNTFNGIEELQRLLDETHLHDAVRLDGHTKIHTFPTWHPRKRLDFVLVSKEIKVKQYSVLKAEFSDHLPILVDFEVRKS